ncbi:MAG: HDOD domain-containing protein [Bryobacterales bacterium]|nr:HDOD domain-containing protein [Bryobacteraceae bacterium]MDW8131228.1 HDOD domain-containing protein [Bryobacterales bacterium]
MPEPATETTPKDLPALSKIPAFPPIVLRIFDLLASEEVEVRRLVELLTADPAFSAQILRLANSPLFGFHSRIESLQHALVILGLKRIRSLAMTVAAANYMQAAMKVQELYRCWRHTLACALLSEELARLTSQPEDVAYTAGLLHDLGRLGLLVAHSAEYAQLLKHATQNGLEMLELERKFFGLDHCEAGRMLAERWNLPEDLRIVAGRHHDPPGGPVRDLAGLVYVACQLADSLGFWAVPPLKPLALSEAREMLPEDAGARLGPDPEQLRGAVERRIRAHELVASQQDSAERPPHDLSQHSTPKPDEAFDLRQVVAAATPARSFGRDLTVVVLTGLIFSVVFIVMFYLVYR